MANTSMTGAELNRTLRTFSEAEKQENNGGGFEIQNGVIVFRPPQTE